MQDKLIEHNSDVSKAEKGDDTLSAVANNYDYRVIVKGKEKDVPTLTKEKEEFFKAALDKYLRKK